MGKAINWPKQFYNEVMAEDTENVKVALRLGSLYYDNGYYNNNELIDIRVDHKIVKQGKIAQEMELYKIKELPDGVVQKYKTNHKTKPDIINFLSANYEKDVNEDTIVTVIYYKNLPLPESIAIDDPHMS